jgi:hypothetical protein
MLTWMASILFVITVIGECEGREGVMCMMFASPPAASISISSTQLAAQKPSMREMETLIMWQNMQSLNKMYLGYRFTGIVLPGELEKVVDFLMKKAENFIFNSFMLVSCGMAVECIR